MACSIEISSRAESVLVTFFRDWSSCSERQFFSSSLVVWWNLVRPRVPDDPESWWRRLAAVVRSWMLRASEIWVSLDVASVWKSLRISRMISGGTSGDGGKLLGVDHERLLTLA